MGIKDLFQNPQGSKVLSSEDFDREVQKVESLENMQAKFYEKRRFMPNVDFSETIMLILSTELSENTPMMDLLKKGHCS